MNTPRCRRCGKVPAYCPCLTNPDAWDADKLPVTVLNSGVVVKVERAFLDYRVSILLPAHRIRNEAERTEALKVAEEWQRAIEARCGCYEDSHRIGVDKWIYRTKSNPQVAAKTNELLWKTALLALRAGESLDKPGRWVRDLLQRLREWFPTGGKAEEVASEILARAGTGEKELTDERGNLWPVTTDRVDNARERARKREPQARAFQGPRGRDRLHVPIAPYHLIEPPEDQDAYLAELERLSLEAWDRAMDRRSGVFLERLAHQAVEAGESVEHPGCWVRDLLWILRPWYPLGSEAEDQIRQLLDRARAVRGTDGAEGSPEHGG